MEHAALVDAFERVFRLSRVHAGEQVVILTDGPLPWPYVPVAHEAFSRLGTPCFQIDLSATADDAGGGARPAPGAIGDLLTRHPAALAALQRADLVVDFLTTELAGLIHDRSRPLLADAGTRMLHVGDPPDDLLRLVPTEDLRERTLAARDRLRDGSAMHVTSPAGTDFHVDLTGAIANALYGFAENPGQATSWPGGFAAAYPVSGTAHGRIVLRPGDLELTSMRPIQSVVTLDWADDHIIAVGGDGLDAAILRDYMAVWDEPGAYGLSHVGWGVNHAARWWSLAMPTSARGESAESRAFAGSFMVSTGVNVPAGRITRCHFDLPMRGCTVTIDGDVVVDQGRLVG